MKFEIVGKEKENVVITMSPLILARSDIFDMLELLLEKIKLERPEILQPFLSSVNNSFKKQIKHEYINSDNKKLRQEISSYKHLEDQYDFVRKHLNFFIQTLNIDEDQLWKDEKVSFQVKSFMESVFTLFYTHADSLAEILGKEDAITFYRKHIDNFNNTINARNQKDIYENLEDLREKQTKWLQNNPYGRVRVFSEVKDGRLIRICMNCEKFDALKDSMFNDKEIFYSIMCYMHIPLAKVWNKNLVLTLDSRVLNDNSYCTYVYHDQSVVKDIIHPSKDFLDEIWMKYK
jgi:hypothetical protein